MQTVSIAGQTFEFRYDLSSAEQFEREIGKEYFAALASPGIKSTRILFRLGVKHQHPKMTDEEAARLVQAFLRDGDGTNNLGRLWKPMFDALKEAGLTAPEEPNPTGGGAS